MQEERSYADHRLEEIGVRRLTPEMTKIFEGTFSLLHCGVQNDQVYRGVFAVRMFPIRFPGRFISLRFTDVDDKEREIGIIDDLSVFPPEAQRLVRASLVRQYYEQTITRIHKIEYKYNLLFFNVETSEGPREFTMWWSQDRAQEYGSTGKVLLDSFDNRYIIPDLSKLPSDDRRVFTAYIYW